MSRAFTMNEAAETLRVSRRAFQDILKRHPFYYPNGRRKLFTEADIEAIRRGLREEERCRLNLSRQGRAKVRTTVSGARTSGSTLTELQELLSKRQRSNSSRPSSGKSNVVALPSR